MAKVKSTNETFNISIAFLFLSLLAGQGIKKMGRKNYTDPGVHANFFLHGIIGFLYYQNKASNCRFDTPFDISIKATRFLALPCFLADIYKRTTSCASFVFFLSGLLPFLLEIGGNEVDQLGNFLLSFNIAMLTYHSLLHDSYWGLITAGAATYTYFYSGKMDSNVYYILGLTLIEYGIYKTRYISSTL